MLFLKKKKRVWKSIRDKGIKKENKKVLKKLEN